MTYKDLLSFGTSAFLGSMVMLGLLTGCATMTPEQQAELERHAAKDVMCTKGEDCETKWGRALYWVSQNSGYRIRTQNESMVETFGPFGQSPKSAFVVNKVPLGKDQYRIVMQSACDNLLGCIPDALTLKAHFNRYVLGELEPK